MKSINQSSGVDFALSIEQKLGRFDVTTMGSYVKRRQIILNTASLSSLVRAFKSSRLIKLESDNLAQNCKYTCMQRLFNTMSM